MCVCVRACARACVCVSLLGASGCHPDHEVKHARRGEERIGQDRTGLDRRGEVRMGKERTEEGRGEEWRGEERRREERRGEEHLTSLSSHFDSWYLVLHHLRLHVSPGDSYLLRLQVVVVGKRG